MYTQEQALEYCYSQIKNIADKNERHKLVTVKSFIKTGRAGPGRITAFIERFGFISAPRYIMGDEKPHGMREDD